MDIAKSDVALSVQNYGPKGRGITAMEPITVGTVIESFPVLVIEPEVYAKVKDLPFINHTFVWKKVDEEKSFGAIGFGFTSLCNHSATPNAEVRRNHDNDSIDLVALRDIEPGEEVTFKYNNTYFEIH